MDKMMSSESPHVDHAESQPTTTTIVGAWLKSIRWRRVVAWLLVSLLLPVLPWTALSFFPEYYFPDLLLGILQAPSSWWPCVLMQGDVLFLAEWATYRCLLRTKSPIFWACIPFILVFQTGLGWYAILVRTEGGLDRLFFVIPWKEWLW